MAYTTVCEDRILDSAPSAAMSQLYAAMSSMSMSIRGREQEDKQPSVEAMPYSSSSSSGSHKKGEDAAVEFSRKRDE